MKVLAFTDAHHFLERTRDFLFQDEVANNLILSSAIALSKSRGRATFLVATDQQSTALAVRTPMNRWMISGLGADAQEAARFLANEIENHAHSLRSVTLPLELAPAFAKMKTLRPAHATHFMSLSKLNSITPASGLMRLALGKDMKTLIEWSKRSAEESGVDESENESSEVLMRYAEHRQLFVWENHGRLVSMAATGGFTPRVARISQVYTDPRERGKSYALTLVHRLTHRLLSESASTCVLFVDSTNSQAQHIYKKLGFETRAAYLEFRNEQDPKSKRPDSDPKPAASSHSDFAASPSFDPEHP